MGFALTQMVGLLSDLLTYGVRADRREEAGRLEKCYASELRRNCRQKGEV